MVTKIGRQMDICVDPRTPGDGKIVLLIQPDPLTPVCGIASH